ncbi:unnamed protein product, partial [Ectocarpus sp. 12 AP-2014]
WRESIGPGSPRFCCMARQPRVFVRETATQRSRLSIIGQRRYETRHCVAACGY